jgi:hypothetical protein
LPLVYTSCAPFEICKASGDNLQAIWRAFLTPYKAEGCRLVPDAVSASLPAAVRPAQLAQTYLEPASCVSCRCFLPQASLLSLVNCLTFACALCTVVLTAHNRLAESNLQAICRDILALYETEGRRLIADAVAAGLLAAVAEGPRATEQFAAVAAVFVGGLAAGARAQDVSARFLEMLAVRLQQVRRICCIALC